MARHRQESSKVRKRKKIQLRDGPGCYLCGNPDCLTLHHIKKKADGGGECIENLCLLCDDCHVYWHQVETPDFQKWVEHTRLFLCKIIFG